MLSMLFVVLIIGLLLIKNL